MTRLCRCLIAVVLAAVLAGPVVACAGEPELAPWPARVAVPQRPGAMGVIRELEESVVLLAMRPRGAHRAGEQDWADAAALLGGGENGERPQVEFERAGAFLYRAMGPAKAKDGRALPEHFVFVSGQRGDEEAPVKLERTWFAYHEPRGDVVRGLALLMPGMFGTPEPILEHFERALTAHGWGVVRMMSQPSRFTERVVFDIDLAKPLESVATIAAEMNTRVAEAAYAAEAAMEHIAGKHPQMAELPRVALGMSGGAMILPTVVAREPEKYAAGVAIAGGANFFAMTDESNYKFMIGAVDFRWLPEAPTDQQREEAYRLYLERAKLDAFHTAVALVGKPMLLIHGTFDAAVPAKLGDLMWERLGKPERWVQEAGHEEVFMKLPGQVEQIMDWLEQAVSQGQEAAPAASGGGG